MTMAETGDECPGNLEIRESGRNTYYLLIYVTIVI